MMGHRLRELAILSTLTGCSLIYNPSNLPDPSSDGLPPDTMPDSPILPVDANPALLELTDVAPRELVEGQGIDGSRRAVVVITGVNLIAGATVQITAHAGEVAVPLVTVHDAEAVVSTDGLDLAVPVTVEIDPAIGPGGTPAIRLDVSVTQPTPGGPITKTLTERATPDDPVLTLRGLREHLGGTLTLDLSQPKHEFSKIDASSIVFTGGANVPVIEAVSSITVGAPISVDGLDQLAGPGGGNGGLGGAGAVGAPGSAGTGDGRGLPDGGGASFGGQGGAGQGSPGSVVGEPSLPTLVSPNRGSGGAGNKGTVLNIRGGNGGGGGGTIALTAGGDLTLAAVTADGGNGTTASGTTGGGGSGGAVLLRAGKTIAITGTGIRAVGGTGGDNGTGGGGDGRVRFDAGVKATTVTSTPEVGHRGAMSDFETPLIVRDQRPTITFNGQPNTELVYTVENFDASDTRSPQTVSIAGSGTIANTLTVDLFRGVNVVCVRVEKATGAIATGKNCITLVFVP